MSELEFKKIVIFGVGLIGGSFALAMRKAKVVKEVVGFGRSPQPLAYAQQLGIIDRIGKDVATEVADADLIFLATPVGQMAELMGRIAPHLGAKTLITDGGSTKSDVVRDAYAHLGKKVAQFVPAHPIAGAEQSGAAAARSDLFQWRKVVLTPLPENSAVSADRVSRAWELCGAMVSKMTPQQHDEIFAVVSHLPHVLSFALVHDISQRANRDQLMSFAASGFRDFTRIAASSPEMWRDICLANHESLLKELKIYISELGLISTALETGDAAGLEEIFRTARELRAGWTYKQ